MKKPTCLILVGIGVLLLVGILVFVVPFIVDMFQELQQMTEQKEEYIYSLSQSVNEPLTEEQEKLLSQLLEEAGETSIAQSPESLEVILSTEPYLTYIKTQDGQDYADFPSYVAAMPTPKHRTVVWSKIKEFWGIEVEPAEQEIWVDYYYIIRDWSKTGKDTVDNSKEFKALLQEHLVEPLFGDEADTSELTSKIVKMTMISILIIEENEVFHSAWRERLNRNRAKEGYLRCAIATPVEFALMRSFFADAAAFEKWISEPFEKVEKVENTEDVVK